MSIPQMMISSEAGWRDLEHQHPTVLSLFLWMVLPLSILPPAMLYYAGTHYGDALMVGWSGKPWSVIAPLFFLCELAAFVGMGLFIRSVVDHDTSPIDTHDAYVVTAIAPVPMWLSSLALLVPNPAFVAVVALTGLVAASALMYRGIYALCHMADEVRAASVTHTVMAAGLLCWAAFLVPILMF
ncbi:Yip1 family protein [Denitromonas sp.]|uniref:Yip1 family protein n=1 Tax=Denitromonas sp. TaxID=2734609 RepID=UPI001D9A08DF|nr:DUF1282 family protein [Rhodocyclaceae bacterium]